MRRPVLARGGGCLACAGEEQRSWEEQRRWARSGRRGWRLFGLKLHVRDPAVEHLPVHLPGMNNVTFSKEAVLQDVLHETDVQKSMLI